VRHELSQKFSKEKFDCIEKQKFQNILIIENEISISTLSSQL
jgi:hypothetical protein